MSSIQDRINEIVDKEFPAELFAKSMELSKYVKNTFGVICPKCHSDQIFESEIQTRSADELSTLVYRCNSCGYIWRGR